MKNINALFSSIIVLAIAVSCGKNDAGNNLPDWKKYVKEDTTSISSAIDTTLILYPDRKEAVIGTDMVLLYGGSKHRAPINWDTSTLRDYVMYTDQNGKNHWFFDSFLCLEFMLTQYNRTLITGYSYNGEYLLSAKKEHWENLADYYFIKSNNLDCLEEAVKSCKTYLGEPPTKRKVFIGVPEPIQKENSHANSGTSTYWGQLDGRTLDFSRTEDRMAAIKWYMNRVITNFAAKNYKYIELAGFYWVAEKATYTRDLISQVANYAHSLNFSFTWIPYFTADGYEKWKSFGFDYAFYQPNYFFNEMSNERLDIACQQAIAANMGMEVEFDGNAMASSGKGYKLREYLVSFKQYEAWEKCRIAYYQGSWAVRWLKYSSNKEDKDLFYYFGDWVVSRPMRDSN